MSQEPAPSGPAWGFREVKVTPPERPYAYRSISTLTYATIGLVGLNALVELVQFAALLGQWRLLGQIRDHAFASQDAMDAAAHASGGLRRLRVLDLQRRLQRPRLGRARPADHAWLGGGLVCRAGREPVPAVPGDGGDLPWQRRAQRLGAGEDAAVT